MVYHRGNVGSYSRWAYLVEDGSYTFPNLLRYFQKSCKFTAPDESKRQTPNATIKFDTRAFNASGGPLEISYGSWRALVAIGLLINQDGFNSGSLNGSSWIPATINPSLGQRSSSESSFLEQTLEEVDNLFVYTQLQAARISIDSKTAYGVDVSTRGVSYTVSARKEVILCAGVFHSPQLLMLSGIGPRSKLEEYPIPAIADLPRVGQNLQDQPIFRLSQKIDIPVRRQLLRRPKAVQQYLQNATGPFSSLNGLIAFEKVSPLAQSNFSQAALNSLRNFPTDWPEVELMTSSSTAPNGSNLANFSAALAAPFSRGSVTITSSDILDPPVIDLGWYTDSAGADIQVAVAAFKRLRAATAAIANITIGLELSPGPSIQSDEDILRHIRNTTVSLHHAGATSAIGRRNDTGAVVARVYGIDHLRVVDVSALPFVPPGHPQSTVYMLAEKIADDILGDR
ncbi:MAG: hypothetical protein Q9198_003711 [Flavoplaca austrocitrina]